MSEPIVAWSRIEPALDRLIACDPAEREKLLSSLAADDPELERELRSLVAAHEASRAFLQESAAELSAPFLVDSHTDAEYPGLDVGRYRLLRLLGRGGMGTVWLAERADGHFERRVAVKLVKRGMDTDEVVARFRRERQILASLDHPSIARLIDGGVTADGRPFLVMDFVDGEPITTYSDRHGLTLEDRLILFEQVCHAVHHAHQNLVVHRDIKPSNVLVSTSGEIRLLDFGIAKLIDVNEGEETQTGWHRPLTLDYATPEQVSGQPVTTATDVYQLGLLLYELVAGVRAYSFRTRDMESIRHTVCEGDIRPPSAAAKTPWLKPLRGTLDAIVTSALNRDPTQRYASAHAMADDLRRYRLGLAVSVRGVPARHRVLRMLRRNQRALVALAMIAATAAATGAMYTVRLRAERDRALIEAAKGRQTAEFIRRFFEGWNPGAADRNQVNVQHLLDEATRRADTELAQQPRMRAAMLSQIGELYLGGGHYQMADSLLNVAHGLQRDTPDGDLAATLARQARLALTTSPRAEADTLLSQALELHGRLFGSTHQETMRVRLLFATLQAARGSWSDAAQVYRDVLDQRVRLRGALLPSLFDTEVQAGLGHALFQSTQYAEARTLLEETLARQRTLVGALHPSTATTMRSLASTLRDMGEFEQAEALYREALRVSEALYGPDHQQTADKRFVLGLQLHRSWKLREAEEVARDGITTHRRIQGSLESSLADWLRLLGMILLDQGRIAEAEGPLQESLARLRREHPGGHSEELDLVNRLAYITAVQRRGDAAAWYSDARRVRERRPAGSPDHLTDGVHFLAWTMNHHGDREEAAALYDTTLILYRRQLPANHPYLQFVDREIRPID